MAAEGFGVNTCEKLLLENLLDALDRLFDRKSSTLDVWALLFATREALQGTEHESELKRPLAELLAVIKSAASSETQRDRALVVTNDLRHYLAELSYTK
jgi:hypothetical protein